MPTRHVDFTRLLRHVVLAWMTAALAMPAAFATPAARADGADMPGALADAVRAYRQATLRNDVTVLATLVADDYSLVNSDGSVQAKPSYLADFRRPGFSIERYVVDQPAHAVWGDTALVRGRLHLTWTQDGARHDRVMRIAHVWIRRDGQWQIAYTQLTRVPDR